VGLHALTDALLGAMADGDIGSHFPPSDPKWRNADSEKFFRHAVDLVNQKGGTITHLDVTLICELPKIGPHRDVMRNEIARMAERVPTEKELEEAKTYLIGSYPLRFDSTTKIASGLLAIRRDNLGVDYIKKRNGLIRALTREQVARAARELLKPRSLRILLLGQPKGVHHQ
jgi:hypothetical protein